MMFDRRGENVYPGTFGEISAGWSTQKVPVKKHEICSDPISADPICPFSNHDFDAPIPGDIMGIINLAYSLLIMGIIIFPLGDIIWE